MVQGAGAMHVIIWSSSYQACMHPLIAQNHVSIMPRRDLHEATSHYGLPFFTLLYPDLGLLIMPALFDALWRPPRPTCYRCFPRDQRRRTKTCQASRHQENEAGDNWRAGSLRSGYEEGKPDARRFAVATPPGARSAEQRYRFRGRPIRLQQRNVSTVSISPA
jgi:hypothetical protein